MYWFTFVATVATRAAKTTRAAATRSKFGAKKSEFKG